MSFVAAPDCEAPADAGADNVYDVTVQVNDGNGGVDTQSIAITVTDADEFDVGTPADTDGAANAVAENVVIGTVVGVTGVAGDADATTNFVTYSLSSNPGGLFAINANTGVVTTAAAIDREALGAGVNIEVSATSADGSSTAQTFRIAIDDVNEAPSGSDTVVTTPEDTAYSFSAADFGFVDPDAGSTLGSVRLDSLPSAGALRFSGAALAAGQVIAGAQLGSLVFTPADDANGTGHASFTFSVSDAAGVFSSTPCTVSIDVSPVNDAPVLSIASMTLLPGQSLVLSAEHLLATDVDDAAAALTFTVSNVANGRFEWTTSPGEAISEFTHADVVRGAVRLVPAGVTQAPSFEVMASDGNLRSAVISATVTYSVQATQVLMPADILSPGSTNRASGPAVESAGASSATLSNGRERNAVARAPVEQQTASAESSSAALLFARGHGLDGYVPTPIAAAAAVVPHQELRTPQEIDPSSALDLSLNITAQEYLLRMAFAPDADALLLPDRAGLRSGLAAPLVIADVDAPGDRASSSLVAAEVSRAAGIALSAGSVWWALRAGGLLASLLGVLPAWRHVDLLAVLPDEEDEDEWDRADDNEAARDEHAVGRMLEPSLEGEPR